MTAGRGDFQGALRLVLPAYLGQIVVLRRMLGKRRDMRRQALRTAQVRAYVQQMARTQDAYAGSQRGLIGIVAGQ